MLINDQRTFHPNTDSKKEYVTAEKNTDIKIFSTHQKSLSVTTKTSKYLLLLTLDISRVI